MRYSLCALFAALMFLCGCGGGGINPIDGTGWDPNQRRVDTTVSLDCRNLGDVTYNLDASIFQIDLAATPPGTDPGSVPEPSYNHTPTRRWVEDGWVKTLYEDIPMGYYRLVNHVVIVYETLPNHFTIEVREESRFVTVDETGTIVIEPNFSPLVPLGVQ